jgi:hypothetical protein
MAACWSRANIRQRLPGKPRAHTAGGRPSSSLGVKSLTLGGQDLWNRERLSVVRTFETDRVYVEERMRRIC